MLSFDLFGTGASQESSRHLYRDTRKSVLMFHFLRTFNDERIRTNARNFGKDLKKFEDERKLPFTRFKLTGGKRGWVFTRRKVFDWLVENDYTEHVLNEEGEENGGIPMPVEDGFTYGSY